MREVAGSGVRMASMMEMLCHALCQTLKELVGRKINLWDTVPMFTHPS